MYKKTVSQYDMYPVDQWTFVEVLISSKTITTSMNKYDLNAMTFGFVIHFYCNYNVHVYEGLIICRMVQVDKEIF